jgi:hypothetical protein
MFQAEVVWLGFLSSLEGRGARLDDLFRILGRVEEGDSSLLDRARQIFREG